MRNFLKISLTLSCLLWPLYSSGADDEEVTREKIQQVLRTYSATNTFNGQLEIFEEPGTTLCDSAGACLQIHEKSQGDIWFSKPFKLKLDYTYEKHYVGDKPIDHAEDEPIALQKFFITNGVISWEYDPWKSSVEAPVSKDYITLGDWENGKPKNSQEEAESKDSDTRRIELSLIASGLGERRTSPFGAVPAYLLAPFRGISRDRISYTGAELASGVSCYRFLVKETAESGRSHHWVSEDDGVVRKIEEFHLKGGTLRRRLELSSLVIEKHAR